MTHTARSTELRQNRNRLPRRSEHSGACCVFCSACKVLDLWVLPRHPHHCWAVEPGDMAGMCAPCPPSAQHLTSHMLVPRQGICIILHSSPTCLMLAPIQHSPASLVPQGYSQSCKVYALHILCPVREFCQTGPMSGARGKAIFLAQA